MSKNFFNDNLPNLHNELVEMITPLQHALNAGWLRLKSSNANSVYEEAFQFFKNAGLYEGLFRPHIPNPVYDNAAKDLGKEFLTAALNRGFTFAELFPGDFNLSTEDNVDGNEVRIFYLTVYKQSKKLGTLKIQFSHLHDQFKFLAPPTVSLFAKERQI